jgi:hypothetical protein
MRECRRHPLESQPSGGVCARCLEERLLWLWRGESFREDDSERVPADQLPGSSQIPEAGSSREPASSSLASVRKQLQVHGVARPPATAGVSSDVERDGGGSASSRDGDSTLQNSKDVMEEWAEFHARRRRSLELGHEGELESPKVKSKSFDAIEPVETTDTENVRRAPNPDLVILMNAQKMRSRSMPLDNRSAEDTALRVINEQADDLFFDELDAYCIAAEDRDGGGEALQESMAAQRCFSPVWQRTSPKWVKVSEFFFVFEEMLGLHPLICNILDKFGNFIHILEFSGLLHPFFVCFGSKSGCKLLKKNSLVKVLVSPMTSRNRVFPSRSKEDARKGRGSRKRGARFASSDWNGKESHGGSSPQWTGPSQAQDRSPAHPRSSTRGSVFSWLQV